MGIEKEIGEFFFESMEKKDDDFKSFSQWLIGNKKYFMFLVSILPIVINTLLNFPEYNVLRAIIENPVRLILITTAIQCLFILFAVFLPVKEILFLVPNNKDNESRKNANEALMQFKNAWTFVWASLFLLYATLFLKYLIPRPFDFNILSDFLSTWSASLLSCSTFFSTLPKFLIASSSWLTSWHALLSTWSSFLSNWPASLWSLFADFYSWLANVSPHQNMLQFFLNLFNNCSSVAIIMCYIIFAKPTASPKGKPITPTTSTGADETSPGSVSKDTSQNLSGINLMCWTVFSLVVVVTIGILSNEFSKWGGAIIAGIAMALFIGRLNNKLIKPSRFITVCLYTYMAIQIIFPLWEKYKGDTDFIVLLSANLAFIFKIVFYLFILWLFQSGKLLFYFVKVRELNKNIDGERQEFADNVSWVNDSPKNTVCDRTPKQT
jgi:hypothetical protein